MDRIKLVAGLGNVGAQYAQTRHNAGFEAVDELAGVLGVEITKEKFGAVFRATEFEDKKLILLKPQQFMNRSGRSIAAMANFYKIDISQILVVTDDMAIEPGMLRLRQSGSAGGHNGLSDIIAHLGTNKFARLRIGIGRSRYPDSKDYVLGRPGQDERELLNQAIAKAVEAIKLWIVKGASEVMNKYNVKNGSSEEK
ncbi:MAG: aminoacyl-tRNA hydrolase [Anaerohalosphaeraceae bacterium]|nr:aminoacyl-tRNA hydrolase [Anaerohalosphaeraceae bacterium]